LGSTLLGKTLPIQTLPISTLPIKTFPIQTLPITSVAINQSNGFGSPLFAGGGWRGLLGVWTLALGLSAAVVAAGARWPQPLTPDGRWVWTLVWGLPLLTGVWLLRGWRSAPGPGDPDRGESGY
jgi:hypothetical protein